MAWTNPRTWVAGEVVDETIMNTHVRDNLNAIRSYVVRKTADESVTSSTALQDDNHLLFAIAANEVWAVEAVLFYTGSTTGDLKVAWTVPAGATGVHGTLGLVTTATGSSGDAEAAASTTLGTSTATASSGSSVTRVCYVTVVNGGTAGNVTLQWAQNTSDGTATTLLTNSFLLANRIA